MKSENINWNPVDTYPRDIPFEELTIGEKQSYLYDQSFTIRKSDGNDDIWNYNHIKTMSIVAGGGEDHLYIRHSEDAGKIYVAHDHEDLQVFRKIQARYSECEKQELLLAHQLSEIHRNQLGS